VGEEDSMEINQETVEKILAEPTKKPDRRVPQKP
jgi:hypothetical protein